MANRQIGWSQESNLLWQIGNQIDRFEKVIFTSLSNTVPSSRTLTINGVTYDLSANRTWSISGGIGGTIATGQVPFGSAANTVSGSNNLVWDNVNGRLGIGNSGPSGTLSVGTSGLPYTIRLGGADQQDSRIYFGRQADISINIANSGGRSIIFSKGYDAPLMRLYADTGNLVLQNGGTFTDGGQRLQVTGDGIFTGGLTSNSGFSVTAGQSFFSGNVRLNNIVGNTGNISIEPSSTGGNITLKTFGGGVRFNSTGVLNNTSGDLASLYIDQNFSPTSGTAAFSFALINPIINQTGGANGITRALYINPTITAASSWRSIEWSNNTGWGLYGQGTADNFLGGGLLINGVLRETITTNRQTASYTLALADRGKLVEMNVATANNLTVPLDSAIAFPVGTKIDISQYGAGQTTVVATGGVTVRSAGGALKLAAQYSGASLVKIATNEWYLFGDITV